MGIINQSELDKKMGVTIDPNSVPRYDGVQQGAMEANFVHQSDTQILTSGRGQQGVGEVDKRGIPGEDFSGSGTVISVSDAPPLQQELEPEHPVPQVQKSVAPAPVAQQSVVPGPQPVAAPKTATELLISMGLIK